MEIKDFEYKASVEITDYKGEGGAVEIPAEINGAPVRKIGNFAFENRKKITSIVIPDTVEEIGCAAFKGCSSLRSVKLPDSITEMSSNAFEGCDSLDEESREAINNVMEREIEREIERVIAEKDDDDFDEDEDDFDEDDFDEDDYFDEDDFDDDDFDEDEEDSIDDDDCGVETSGVELDTSKMTDSEIEEEIERVLSEYNNETPDEKLAKLVTASESNPNVLVVHSDDTEEGISAEYAWMRVHYPGSELTMQSLDFEDARYGDLDFEDAPDGERKPFDTLYITLADGGKKKLVFDISQFYGK